MNYTANYNLNQWEADDRVTREDFNADNAAIDAALGAKAEIVFGYYQGDGSSWRDIELGFFPRWVLLADQYGRFGTNGGLFAPSNSLKSTGTGATIAITYSAGFNLRDAQNSLNVNGVYYYYIACR